MKQQKIFFMVSLLALLLVTFGACKKVINLNLNSTNPLYVVQGNVSDQLPPYLVSISKTVNFSQDNTFPTVSGALVVITDVSMAIADTLKETTPGNYYTSLITGIPGHTYQLYVSTGGNVFTALSTMPPHVSLDSLYTQPSAFGGDQQLVPLYTDPLATGNYYYFEETKNDTVVNEIYARNDALINGQVVRLPLNGGGLQTGDVVSLDMQCIDSAMYQYYYGLNQTKNQNSATPTNPNSNIAGGALGYFSAHTSSVKSIVVQ
jgi:hypothetical protein